MDARACRSQPKTAFGTTFVEELNFKTSSQALNPRYVLVDYCHASNTARESACHTYPTSTFSLEDGFCSVWVGFGRCVLVKDLRCVLFARNGDETAQPCSQHSTDIHQHHMQASLDISLEGTVQPTDTSSHFGIHRSPVSISGLSVLLTTGRMKT